MMTKEKLSLYRSAQLELDNIKSQIAHLQNSILASSPLFAPDALQQKTPAEFQKYSSLLLKINRLEDDYLRQLEKLVDLQLEIETSLQRLTPLERALMRYRYIEGLDFFKISIKLSYERAQTFRIHAQALKKLQQIPIAH